VSSAPIPLPAELVRELGAILHRSLRDLPLTLLEAMLRGLRRHADGLAPERQQRPPGAVFAQLPVVGDVDRQATATIVTGHARSRHAIPACCGAARSEGQSSSSAATCLGLRSSNR